jgi:hypothetical protein
MLATAGRSAVATLETTDEYPSSTAASSMG